MFRASGVRLDLPSLPPLDHVGVEQELRLWSATEHVDFRSVLPVVAGHVAALDPGDPRARRLPSGVTVTADGWEAELVTPPLPVAVGAYEQIDALLDAETATLLALCRDQGLGDRVTGYSTHLNVSVRDDDVCRVGIDFVRHCSVPLMLLTEAPDSPGVLVRPRRGRLEICTEHVDGDDLVAALTFVVGCLDALRSHESRPPRADLDVVPAREKFGWYVDRCATGSDLAVSGRATTVDTDEGVRTAQRLLERTWAWARPSVLRRGIDPTPVDARVRGTTPIPLERTGPPARVRRSDEVQRPVVPAVSDTAVTDTAPRFRDDLVATTAWLTWTTVAWRVEQTSTGRSAHVVLDARQEPEFLRRLDAGVLDDVVRAAIARRRRSRLLVNRQLAGAAIWRDVRPGALVPAERAFDGRAPRVGRGTARRAFRRDQEVVR